MPDLVSPVRQVLASKLRGPGFKSQQVQWVAQSLSDYNNVECSARLKTGLNPVIVVFIYIF